MARARSAKDGKAGPKESRKEAVRDQGPPAGPAGTAGTVPDVLEDVASLLDRVAVLEARLEVLEAGIAVAADTAGAAALAGPAASGGLDGAPHTPAAPDAAPLADGVPLALADGLPPTPPDGVPVAQGDGAPGPHLDSDLDDDDPPTPGVLRERHGKTGGLWIIGAARLPRGVKATWNHDVATADLLDRDWAGQADALAALAHPVRLAVLREVLRGSRSVSSLATLPGVGTSGQLYHHIKPLLARGWLRQDGRGRYEVPESRVLPLLTLMAAVAG
ncbi:MAG: helix-turn-helix domain-containing protein [Kineosporiaceae bacterium]